MSEAEALSYVIASAAALELPLDPTRAQRVAVHLHRTAGLAAQLQAWPLTPEDEPAEVYRPALHLPRN